MSNLQKAKTILNDSDYTCVICSDDETLISQKHGVAPLLDWLDKGKCLTEYSAADKIVGNGAAFLYVLLDVKELYAEVISKSALETLAQHHIPVTYDILTEAILNREHTGFCPIESAVIGISSPQAALTAIRQKLKEMKNK